MIPKGLNGLILVGCLSAQTALAQRDEAYEFAAGAQESAAYEALRQIRRASPDVVEREVAAFLDAYPGTKWRREAYSQKVRAAVSQGQVAAVVDGCLHLAMHVRGDRLGDIVVRDSWIQLAQLFERNDQLLGASRLRYLVLTEFPYRLEHGQQVVKAAGDLVKGGAYREALAVAKLALAVADEGALDEAVELVKASLDALQGPSAAKAFEAYWRYGRAGPDALEGTQDDCTNPLARVALLEQDRLRQSAKAVLAADGLLSSQAATGTMQRAFLHLFAEQYELAASDFARAIALADAGTKAAAAYQAGSYFRLLDGHRVRSDRLVSYVRWGRGGPDGVLNTQDDTTDPFSEPLHTRPDR